MSRSTTQKFLVGQFSDKLPGSQLPTEKDVLKFLFHKKHEESLKNKKTPSKQDLVACPLDRKTHTTNCEDNETCTEEVPCVVRAIKKHWINAGFPTIQDRYIKDKVLRLDKEWMSLNKHSKRDDDRFKKNCEDFKTRIDGLFNIGAKDIESIIGNNNSVLSLY